MYDSSESAAAMLVCCALFNFCFSLLLNRALPWYAVDGLLDDLTSKRLGEAATERYTSQNMEIAKN
jgi:hypothetical protein